MRKIITFFILILSTTVYSAPSFGPQELTLLAKKYLATRANAEQVNVIAISAETPSHQIYSAYANVIDQSKKINPDSLFQIGSLTKSFIAVIILQLEADPHYHFNINQSLIQYFPQYKKWQNIRIKNLLNMTSGIPDFLDDPDFFREFSLHPHQPQAINKWLNEMYARHLLFFPGTQFNYSNTNYFILGLLIEKLTGHSLQFEINNRLVKPLNLKNTFYTDNRINKKIGKRLIHGYQSQSAYARFIPLRTDVTKYNMSYAGAAAGIVSTSMDLMKWIQAMFTPGKLLKAKQLKELTSLVSEKTGKAVKILSPEDAQGFGLGIRAIYYAPSKASYVFAYEGLTLGYRAIYVYSPEDKVLITATVNSNYYQKNNYLFALINHVFQKIVS